MKKYKLRSIRHLRMDEIMVRNWIRLLSVEFSNGGNTVVYGNKFLQGKNDVSIHVSGSKFMGALKDSCKIVIDNLPYSELLNLIDGKYFDVKIKAGYKGSGDVTMFDGGVLYISNNRTNTKTTQAIILCASKLVAKFSQSRINLTLNSGLNLYSAAKYVLSKAGVKNPNISEGLKSTIIKNVQNVNDTAGGWLNKLLENNKSFVCNSDNSFSSNVTLFDAANSQNRYITLTNKILDLTGGYPQISSEGLRLTCMPTYNFMCGDIIKIDNSVIQAPISSQKALTSPSTFFIDEDGEYIIFEIDYSFENRGENFTMDILAKSRNKFRKIRGTT